jgi:hypothetical protein
MSQPRIKAEQIEEISEYMLVWDYLTFNVDGDILYKIEFDVPMVGKIIVSYWEIERSLRIFTEKQGPSGDDVIFSDNMGGEFKLGTLANRDRIVKFAKRQLAKRMQEVCS